MTDSKTAQLTEVATRPGGDSPRKPSRRAVAAAVVTIVAAVLCMALLYNREYVDAANTTAVESVIDERIGTIHATDAHVLESKSVGNNLFVLFEQLGDESDTVCGVAQFRGGLFGRYGLRSVSHAEWPLYTWSVVEGGVKNYLVVYGVHEPRGAETIRIYAEESPSVAGGGASGNYSGVEPLYSGPAAAPLLEVVPISQEQALSLYHFESIHYYDADGNELDARELAEEFGYEGMSGGGTAYSSQRSLYVFFAVVILFTFVIARYFLTP